MTKSRGPDNWGKILGDVQVLGLANLLQLLAANELEGVLTVHQGEDRKSIQFLADGIRLIGTGRWRRHTLGEILIRAGKLTRPQLDALLSEQKKTGQKLGVLISAQGLLSRSAIDNALREQAEEEIHDLFTWPRAQFEFSQGDASSRTDTPLAGVKLDSNLTSLMLEAARRADEVRLIREVIPDDGLVPVRLTREPPKENPNLDSDVLMSIFPLLDGKRPVGAIVAESLHPRFPVLRTLYVLANEGSIKFPTKEEIEKMRGKNTLVRGALFSGKPAAPPPPKEAAPTHTLLLISDLPKFRSALATSLRASRYDVVEQDLSPSIVQVAGRYKVHGTILDISLPNTNALKLCAPLKEATGAPVVVLSSNKSKNAVVTAVREGARDYIVKPFKHETLLRRLLAVITG